MVSKVNLLAGVNGHKVCPINFLLLVAVVWLRLLALYDYSICILMPRPRWCHNLFPLFSSLYLTQHLTQLLWNRALVMNNLSSSLLSWCSSSVPSCSADVFFKEDLWISSLPHPLTLGSAAPGGTMLSMVLKQACGVALQAALRRKLGGS